MEYCTLDRYCFLAFSAIKLGKDFEEFMGLAGSIFAWILTGSTLLSIIDRSLAPFAILNNND